MNFGKTKINEAKTKQFTFSKNKFLIFGYVYAVNMTTKAMCVFKNLQSVQ